MNKKIVIFLVFIFVIIFLYYKINYKIVHSTDNYLNAPYEEISIKNSSDTTKSFDLQYSIDYMSEELKLNDDFSLEFLVSTDNGITFSKFFNINGNLITSSKLSNSFNITEEISPNTKKIYRVYAWLKKGIENKILLIKSNLKVKNHEKFNKNYHVNLNACDELEYKPVIEKNLIPVKITDDGTVKTSSNDNDWYNYCDKKWANAVLVNSSSRQKYVHSNNMIVNNDDIIAYFVWIPRYSYKIWTLDSSTNKYGQEQEIIIKFVDKDTKDIGSKIGDWYTHPAFTFGDKELSGFWIGKFEITGTMEHPTILPNQRPIVNYNLNDYLNISLKFSGGILNANTIEFFGSNEYGLSSNTNSHIIKNSEWGAAAYLSHSRYGILNKIHINNYFNDTNLTGCGSSDEFAYSSTNCEIEYGNSNNYPQSSTGNITGVFDMSGGTGEYVMAYIDYNNNLSGISDKWFFNENNKKYYDFYSHKEFNDNYIDNMKKCDLKNCGGQALYETYEWYGTFHNFVNDKFNFIKRGCGNYSYSMASQFCFGYATGEPGKGTSSRIVLII